LKKLNICLENHWFFHETQRFFEVFGLTGTGGSFDSDFSIQT
jgi:hypothetical protein